LRRQAPRSWPTARGAVAVAALLWLSACSEPPGPADSASGPVDGDWLVARMEADPTDMNWIRATDRPTLQIGRLVSDSLVDHAADLTLVPRLASGWEISEGGRQVTFRLRDDVRWHDGRPFTADDVLFSYAMAVDPATGAGKFTSYFSEVESVRAPDPRTVQVTYGRAFAPALQGWVSLLILPRHVWEGLEVDDAPQVVVGTGPFRMLERQAGRQVVLEANDDYWGGRPHLDRILFRIIPDAHTSFEALQTSELDLSPIVPADWPTAGPLEAEGKIQLIRYRAQKVVFIAWNGDGSNPFFGDPRVRNAMTHALDREGFIRTVLRGLGRSATSTFMPDTWASNAAIVPLPYDLEAASRLLDEAGWLDGDRDGIRERDGIRFQFTLNVYQSDPNSGRVALVLQDALRRLGVSMEIDTLELPVFLERLHTRNFQAQLSAWGLDVDPDPFDFWHSSQSPGGQNYAGFADDEVDALCEEGRGTLDIDARAALYRRVHEVLHAQQPFTFVYHPENVRGLDVRLRGVQAAATGIWGWYPSTLEWWVPTPLQRYPIGESRENE
jgi:peptide/nickel transport system substrate-binding protein